MTASPPILPFDPELDAVLIALKDVLPGTVTPDMIPAMQAQTTMAGVPTPEEILAENGLIREDHTITGHGGG